MAKLERIELLTVAAHYGGESTIEKPSWRVKRLLKKPALAAEVLLTDHSILRDVSDSHRLDMCTALFSHFKLVNGWLTIAQAGGLKNGQIACLITSRVEMIKTPQDAEKERQFLEVLCTPGDKQSYGPILSDEQFKRILAVINGPASSLLKQLAKEDTSPPNPWFPRGMS